MIVSVQDNYSIMNEKFTKLWVIIEIQCCANGVYFKRFRYISSTPPWNSISTSSTKVEIGHGPQK